METGTFFQLRDLITQRVYFGDRINADECVCVYDKNRNWKLFICPYLGRNKHLLFRVHSFNGHDKYKIFTHTKSPAKSVKDKQEMSFKVFADPEDKTQQRWWRLGRGWQMDDH